MGGDVYLFCARHPLRIDLRRDLFVIAADGMQIAVERFIRVVRQQRQPALQRVPEEGLFQPMDSETADGMRVHERFVRRLHRYTEVGAVIDMSVGNRRFLCVSEVISARTGSCG